MQRIDAVFVARPFYGSRRIAVALSMGAERVNRERMQPADALDRDRSAGTEAAHPQAVARA